MENNLKLNEAKKFIFSNVIDPALNSKEVSQESKGKIRRTKLWVDQCQFIGDIYDYISRYKGEADELFRSVYLELKSLSMTPIEDITDIFAKKFSDSLHERLSVQDLQVGQTYSSWDISIISRRFNEQQGIYLVREGQKITHILTKVTLNNDSYKNEWLDENTLKHYMKSRLDNFDENYLENRAVISKSAPIHVFIKNGKQCNYNGIFRYDSKSSDETGAKWFILKRIPLNDSSELLSDYIQNLEKEVIESSKLSPDERRVKMLKYPEIPKQKYVLQLVYDRNPHVVQQTLERAKGICELCLKKAPFQRKRGKLKGHPYLEVHHKQPLSMKGKDILQNTIALCPNCHRKAHLG